MQHILITGGHSGIGLELTKMLLKKEDVKIGLVIRSEKRKAGLSSALLNAPIDFFFSDLSDQASVKALAEKIKSHWDKVDVLFNNAGVLLDGYYTSPQGNEMHLEVNTLAPYLLTQELAPLLKKAEAPLVLNTLTGGLNKRKALKLSAFEQETPFRKLFGPYVESKFALALLSPTLSEQVDGLRIINVNPGPNKTSMTQGSGMPKWLLPLRNAFFPKATRGAGLLYKAAFERPRSEKAAILLNETKEASLVYTISPEEKDNLLNRMK